MVTGNRFLSLRGPTDDDDRDPGDTTINPRDAEANRFHNTPRIREFPAPNQNDYDLISPPDVLGPPDYIEPISMQRDPRIDAIEQMARQGQVQRPGMKNEDDLDAFERQQGLENSRDRLRAPPRRTLGDMMGMPYGGQGTPDETAEADATSKMTDEQILEQVQRGIGGEQKGYGDIMQGQQPNSDDSNALAPFTGEYSTDLKILERELKVPGADQGELNRMFNELHGGDDEPDDRDSPTNENDMRKGRY